MTHGGHRPPTAPARRDLVIDDEARVHSPTARVLEPAGFTVTPGGYTK